MAPQTQDWSWLDAKLQRGEDLPQQVEDFVKAGGNANDMVVSAMGNREQKLKPCPKSLKVLLENKADANLVEKRVGSPLIHIAAWMSTTEVITLLLDHGADMEIGEQGVPTPPLNTALAAGNGPVALLLLNRRANVQWKHEDGATPLHVATAWISDSERSHRRRPPVGDEPREIIAKLLHNGADPSQREGMRGMPLLDAFREGMRTSPWIQDEDIGDEFKVTSQKIFDMISAADQAMKFKAKGNKAFTANNHSEALEFWAGGRHALEKGAISGHHMAVLWSNEANCCKKIGDLSRCSAACNAGLGHYCASSVRAKLEYHLAECAKQANKAEETLGSETGAQVSQKPRDVQISNESALDEPSGKPAANQSPVAKIKKETTTTKLKQGFFSDVQKPMYGPEGSVQGLNMSQKVMAPVCVGGIQQRMPVEYGKIIPLTVDHEPKEDDDD